MKDLLAFLKNTPKKDLYLANDLENSITNSIANVETLNIEEKQKFSKSMTLFAESEELITQINNKLPPPLQGESKERFVTRGLELIKRILIDKLK